MKINEREYNLKFTGESLIIFKEAFHKDLLTVVAKPDNFINDFELLFAVIWTLAKTGGEMPEYKDFMASLGPTAVRELIKMETIKEVLKVINGDSEMTVEDKKK